MPCVVRGFVGWTGRGIRCKRAQRLHRIKINSDVSAASEQTAMKARAKLWRAL
jgi:hypothetical protein